MAAKRLTAKQRRALPKGDFALPGKGEGPEGKGAGSYPVEDERHARAALSLVSQHGSSGEKAAVRRKVREKFPGIQQKGEHGGKLNYTHSRGGAGGEPAHTRGERGTDVEKRIYR